MKATLTLDRTFVATTQWFRQETWIRPAFWISRRSFSSKLLAHGILHVSCDLRPLWNIVRNNALHAYSPPKKRNKCQAHYLSKRRWCLWRFCVSWAVFSSSPHLLGVLQVAQTITTIQFPLKSLWKMNHEFTMTNAIYKQSTSTVCKTFGQLQQQATLETVRGEDGTIVLNQLLPRFCTGVCVPVPFSLSFSGLDDRAAFLRWLRYWKSGALQHKEHITSFWHHSETVRGEDGTIVLNQLLPRFCTGVCVPVPFSLSFSGLDDRAAFLRWLKYWKRGALQHKEHITSFWHHSETVRGEDGTMLMSSV